MNEGELQENNKSWSNSKGFPNKNKITNNGNFSAEKPFLGSNRIKNELSGNLMQLQANLKNHNALLRSQHEHLNLYAKQTLENYDDVEININSSSQIYSPKTVSVNSNNNMSRKDSANKKTVCSSVFDGLNSLSSSKILSNHLNNSNNNKLNKNNNNNNNNNKKNKKPNTDISCELRNQNLAAKNSSNQEKIYPKTHIKNSALDSKFATIEASSLEKNKAIYNNLMQSKSSKTSQSYKKDAFARSVYVTHSMNCSKDRKIEQAPNLINKWKSSKNKIDSVNHNIKNDKNNKNCYPNKLSKADKDIHKDYFYKGCATNTSDDSVTNYQKFRNEKPLSSLTRNESAKNLTLDRHKIISKYNVNNNSNNLLIAKSNQNINCDDFNFDNYLERRNSKTKFLSHRKHKENSLYSRINDSFSNNCRENSQSRKKAETSERLDSKGQVRNESSHRNIENEKSLKIQAKPKKASNLYEAENRKLIMKMPTLKYENICKKPFIHIQKSHSSKINHETRTVSPETFEENPSETYSLERNSNLTADLNVFKSYNKKTQKSALAEQLKTEDSRDFTSKETNLSVSNHKKSCNRINKNTYNQGSKYKEKNNFNNNNNNEDSNNDNLLNLNSTSPNTNFSSSKKVELNKINLKKLSNYIDFLQKEKISEDLKTLKAQKTFESSSTNNKYSELENNLSSSRQMNNMENENSVFYTVNTECNSIAAPNLNSKNLNDFENDISNSVSINYLGNEYVRKLKNTFMQVNRKGMINMHSSLNGDNETNVNQTLYNNSNNFKNFCATLSTSNEVSSGNLKFKHSENSGNLKLKNFGNNKINYMNNSIKNGNRTSNNTTANNLKNVFTVEEAKKHNSKYDYNCNINSNSKQKIKSVYNNNSNLSLRNYAVCKEKSNALAHNIRDGSRPKDFKRSKSKHDDKSNLSKNKEAKLNCLNQAWPLEKAQDKLNSLKSPKNLNSSKITYNYLNNLDKSINALPTLNSYSIILSESKNRKSSKENSLKKSSSKSKFNSNCKENERSQTAKIRKESSDKLSRQPSNKAKLPEKRPKNKLNMVNVQNNFPINNQNKFESNCIQGNNDNLNSKFDTEANNKVINHNTNYNTKKTIHINHNFNHNINHNILINIENPEGISAENFKKSFEKFHSSKNNKNNSSLQKPQNIKGGVCAQINTSNYKLNLEDEKDKSFSEINFAYLNTDDVKITGSDSKIRDIISSLELAKESNTNLKNHKRNFKKINNNEKIQNENKYKKNFYCENDKEEDEKITERKNSEKPKPEAKSVINHMAVSQKNVNVRIPINSIACDKEKDKDLFASMIGAKEKLKILTSNNSINLKNNHLNLKDFSCKELQSNFSTTRIVNKDTIKFSLETKESLNDPKHSKKDFIQAEKKIANHENNNINKTNHFTNSNSNNRLLEELKYNLSLKQISLNKELEEKNSNCRNFETLRKNLLATYNNNNKDPNHKESLNHLKEAYKFDKMEFFKCKNAAVETEADEYNQNFGSKEALNTEPNLPLRPEKIEAKEKEDLIKNINFNKSNFKFTMQEGKLSFLEKPKLQNLNINSTLKENLNLNKPEFKENKNLAENTKPAAKPSFLSESVNINFKPLDFLKNQSLVKNKQFKLSMKFKGKIGDTLKEDANYNQKFASQHNFNTISAQKQNYLDYDFNKDKALNTIDIADDGGNLKEKFIANEKKKLNLFNVHEKLNLIKNKNELFESFNLKKKESKNPSNNSNNALSDEDSNAEVKSKKYKKNSIKLNSHSLKNSSSSKSKSKSYTGSQYKDRESIPKEKDLLEQTISYIISDDEPNSKENRSNLNLNTEESFNNNNINKNADCRSSLFYINNSNDEVDFEKFYEEMNMKLMSDQSSNRK